MAFDLSVTAGNQYLFVLTSEIGFNFSSNCLIDGYHASSSPNWNQVQINGRSSPIIMFANTNPMMLSLNIPIFEIDEEEQGDVVKIGKSFLALTKPTKPGVEPPPLCHITLGSFFEDWECVVASVDVHMGDHGIWNDDMDPITGMISLQLMGVEVENVSAQDIVASGDYTQFATT